MNGVIKKLLVNKVIEQEDEIHRLNMEMNQMAQIHVEDQELINRQRKEYATLHNAYEELEKKVQSK